MGGRVFRILLSSQHGEGGSQLEDISRAMSYLGPKKRRCQKGHLIAIENIVVENRKGHPKIHCRICRRKCVRIQHARVQLVFTRSSRPEIASNTSKATIFLYRSQIDKEFRRAKILQAVEQDGEGDAVPETRDLAGFGKARENRNQKGVT